MEARLRTAKALLEVDAVKFNESEPFVYAARKVGPIYLDLRQVSRSPSHWNEVVTELTSLIRSRKDAEGFDVVSGGELADLLFSIPVAMRMSKPHIIIRKAEKGHGAGGRIAGRLDQGQRVVHVSDLITSGTSALDWVRVIRQAGGVLSDYFVVFDRDQGGDEALSAIGVHLHPLVTLGSDFLTYSAGTGMIPAKTVKVISAYLDDPEGWAESFLLNHPDFLSRRVAVKDGTLARRDGIEILTTGYPSLLNKLRPFLIEALREMGLKEPVESLGYQP